MGSVLDLLWGLLSYVAFTGAGGLVGYFFARKRTEHEVGYGRRVETVERIQDSVAEVVEELMAAREIWLNRETFTRLEALTVTLRAYQRELASLPLYYEDPDFEREHERVGRELDRWLKTDLPAAREELADG